MLRGCRRLSISPFCANFAVARSAHHCPNCATPNLSKGSTTPTSIGLSSESHVVLSVLPFQFGPRCSTSHNPPCKHLCAHLSPRPNRDGALSCLPTVVRLARTKDPPLVYSATPAASRDRYAQALDPPSVAEYYCARSFALAFTAH